MKIKGRLRWRLSALATAVSGGTLYVFAPIPIPRIPGAEQIDRPSAAIALVAVSAISLAILVWCSVRVWQRGRKVERALKAASSIDQLNPDAIRQRIETEREKLTGKNSRLRTIIDKAMLLHQRAAGLGERLLERAKQDGAPTYMQAAADHSLRIAGRLHGQATRLDEYRRSIDGVFDGCLERAKLIDVPVADYRLLKELQEISSEADSLREEGAQAALAAAQQLFSQQDRIAALVNESINRSGIEVAVLAADASGERFQIEAMEEAIGRMVEAVPKFA